MAMVIAKLGRFQRSVMTYILFGIIILSFIWWGGSGMQGERSPHDLTIGSVSVSPTELNYELELQRQFYQSLAGAGMSDELTAFLKRNAVSSVVRQAVFSKAAKELSIPVGPEEIGREIRKIPAFQDPETKTFKRELFMNYLDYVKLTPKRFDQRIAAGLASEKLRGAVKNPIVVSAEEAWRSYRIDETKVALEIIDVDPQADFPKLSIPEEKLRAFYDSHQAQYQSPEQRKIEVLFIRPDSVKRSISISDDEVRDYYRRHIEAASGGNRDEYEQPRAAADHILVELPKGASARDREQSRKKAEALLRKAKENPDRFTELARENSDDPSAAQNGGDLGYFSARAMVKPFSDAVLASKPGAIIGPVESEFGFHVIRVRDVHPETGVRLEKFSKEIEDRIRAEKLTEQLNQSVGEIQRAAKAGAGNPGPTLKALSTQYSGQLVEALVRSDSVIPTIPDSFSVISEAFRIKAGELSSVQRHQDRIYLFRVAEVHAPKPLTFEEAKSDVGRGVRKQELETYLKNEVAKATNPDALAKRLQSTVRKTGSFPLFTTDRIPTLGWSDSVLSAQFKEIEPNRFLPLPVSVDGRIALVYVRSVERPTLAEFLKTASDHRAKVEEEQSLAAVLSLSNALDERYGITPAALSQLNF